MCRIKTENLFTSKIQEISTYREKNIWPLKYYKSIT